MKTILITGATSGIGLEAAVALSKQGHRVMLVGRDAELMAAVDDVKRRAGVTDVGSFLCDFSSQAQVRHLASEVLATCERLDVLVNNAGTVTRQRELTEDGIESMFAVNHLGAFLLTNLLLDLLREERALAHCERELGRALRRDHGRRRPPSRAAAGAWWSYRRSKLANMLFTRTLAKRLEGKVSP